MSSGKSLNLGEFLDGVDASDDGGGTLRPLILYKSVLSLRPKA